MKTIRRILATMLLALVLGVSAFAGDMGFPPGDMGNGGSSVAPGDMDTSGSRSGEMSGPSNLMAIIMQTVLDSLGR